MNPFHSKPFNFEDLANSLTLPAFIIDKSGVVRAWNGPCERLTGKASASIIGTKNHWIGFYPSERPTLADLVLLRQQHKANELYALHQKSAFAEDGYQAEGWFDSINGQRRYLIFEAKPILIDGELAGVLETLQDFSSHMLAAERLKLTNCVYENTSEGILILDKHHRIASCNEAFCKTSGYCAQEALGQQLPLFSGDNHSESFFVNLFDNLAHNGHWQGDMRWSRKNGSHFHVRCFLSCVHDSYQSPTHYVALVNDITETELARQKIEHMAHHDYLTGLPNRSLLEDRIRQTLLHCSRNNSRFAVLFLDLDKFKLVNDTLGHDHGDELLKLVADRLKSALRASDTVSRQGGDEFVILIDNIEHETDAAHVAQNILQLLSQPFSVLGRTVNTGTSIGISLYPRDGTEPAQLIKNADAAMYHAKSNGRGNFQYFTESVNHKAVERLLLENGLKTAIQTDEIELFYQPQLAADTHSIYGAEALARWKHPVLGYISPAKFIPVAEDCGLIHALGRFALFKAAETISKTRIPIAVNVSAKQLARADFVQEVQNAIDSPALRFNPNYLTLEITESAFITNFYEASQQLSALKKLGVRLALDDFGTGYSSLAYLCKLPFDYIKIDKSFISEDNEPMLCAIIDMAYRLNMSTVAEGVETVEQQCKLTSLGCNIIQGYLFAKPMPFPEFAQFAASHASIAPCITPSKSITIELNAPATSVPAIEIEHAKLALLLSDFLSCATDNNIPLALSAFHEFAETAQAHFKTEEELMRDNHYPNADEHLREHILLTARIKNHLLQLERNSLADLPYVAHDMERMFQEHIVSFDCNLGSWLDSHKRI